LEQIKKNKTITIEDLLYFWKINFMIYIWINHTFIELLMIIILLWN
jgi:hypothetical protein